MLLKKMEQNINCVVSTQPTCVCTFVFAEFLVNAHLNFTYGADGIEVVCGGFMKRIMAHYIYRIRYAQATGVVLPFSDQGGVVVQSDKKQGLNSRLGNN